MSMINESFADLRSKLETKGIKDLECFKLNNHWLTGVDPFDPKLAESTKLAIKQEAKNNFWYFIEYCVRVMSMGDDKAIPFKINLTNFESLYALTENCNVYTVSPRQRGLSLSHCVYILWQCYRNQHFGFMTIGASKQVDEYLFDKITYDLNRWLPNYMKVDHYSIKDKKFNSGLLFTALEGFDYMQHNESYFCQINHYLSKINLIYLDGFECFSNGLIKKVIKLLNISKQLGYDIQVAMVNTGIGRKDTLGRDLGDLYSSTLRHLEVEDLNEGRINPGEFLYVYNDYTELVDNPDIWLGHMSKIYEHNSEAINSEILCKRI